MSSTHAASTAAASLSNHDAKVYRANANFVYSDEFSAPVLALLDAKPGEKIVDLGCGSGELTVKLAEFLGVDGHVLGIDSSEDMLVKAQALAQGASNISFLPATDIQSYSPAPKDARAYDAVFSNAVLHWCKRDPGGVLEAAKKLLKPGGRFAVEFGGHMNMIGVRGSIHGALKRRGIDPEPLDPWYFPTVEDYTELLEKHGFKPHCVSLHPRPTKLPTNLRGWLITFARSSFLSSFDDAEAEEIMKEVVDELTVDCCDSKGRWQVMYVRMRVSAIVA